MRNEQKQFSVLNIDGLDTELEEKQEIYRSNQRSAAGHVKTRSVNAIVFY